jgi:dCTP deaminase
MLSDIDIRDSIRRRRIRIVPFNPQDMMPDTYKLHLDGEIAVPNGGVIDREKVSDYSSFYEKKKAELFVLRPGAFILGRTEEKITVPSDLVGFINGKTGLARLGISVVQTASIIHSGHGSPHPRKIVLEISNVGPFDIVLHKGMTIGEIAFIRLVTPASTPYDRKWCYGKRKSRDELVPMKD